MRLNDGKEKKMSGESEGVVEIAEMIKRKTASFAAFANGRYDRARVFSLGGLLCFLSGQRSCCTSRAIIMIIMAGLAGIIIIYFADLHRHTQKYTSFLGSSPSKSAA
jgi:hypothetical protein